MDSTEIFVLIGGTLLIGFILWFFFGAREDAAVAKNDDGRPVYECPMHPWIMSVDPAANCSLCGMKLVRRGDANSKHDAMPHAEHGAPHH